MQDRTSTETALEGIVKKIVTAFNPIKIVLFGSHATGTPKEDSDLDLLVIMESGEGPVKRAAAVSKLLRPREFPIDIVVRTPKEVKHQLEIGDYFFKGIMERGRILYERSR